MKRLLTVLGLQALSASLAFPCLMLAKEMALSLACLEFGRELMLVRHYPTVAMTICVCGHVLSPAVWAWAKFAGRNFAGLERLQLMMSSLEVVSAAILLLLLTASMVYLQHGLLCEPIF